MYRAFYRCAPQTHASAFLGLGPHMATNSDSGNKFYHHFTILERQKSRYGQLTLHQNLINNMSFKHDFYGPDFAYMRLHNSAARQKHEQHFWH
jgi:hypothetical protein